MTDHNLGEGLFLALVFVLFVFIGLPAAIFIGGAISYFVMFGLWEVLGMLHDFKAGL